MAEPKNPTRLVIEIEPEKRRRLKVVAAERGTTMKRLVEECIERLTAAPDASGAPLPEKTNEEKG